MKAALITEEQIKAIEDALESLHTAMTDGFVINSNDIHEALDIVKSLKVQEPVAWGVRGNREFIATTITPKDHDFHEGEFNIPLYAGEKE